MLIGVLKESTPGERRVSAVPDTVARLVKAGNQVVVEQGAGSLAGFPDAEYIAAGASVDSRESVLAADLVAGVVLGPDKGLEQAKALVGLMAPFQQPEFVSVLATAGTTAIAFETVPRTSLAQTMDALSSQANTAGYRAVLEGASRLQRFLPMMTTAAGTVKPARLLVLGVGVAGLQAIATGRRLGAVVSAFDVRSAAREQVESLGATFIEVSLEDHTDKGGYATALADVEQARIIRGLTESVSAADIVISTAQIPGRAAPLLIDDESLVAMRPGSVIIDLASDTGGNTSQTPSTGDVNVNGVRIVAGGQLVSAVASDASTLLGRNLVALVGHLYKEETGLDFEDEITAGAVVASGGEILNDRVRSLLEGN